MKLESQVCNLELSKKLRELGVPQESLFCWIEEAGKKPNVGRLPVKEERYAWFPESYPDLFKWYSAFTIAEMGEMLPDAVASYRYRTIDEGDKDEWACIKYVEGNHAKYERIYLAPTEADARAKMLIYLLENKIYKL